jgi:hypothetical protein
MRISSERYPGFWEELFRPDYDEISLFSIGYILLLLILVKFSPAKWDLSFFSLQYLDFDSAMIMLFLVALITGMLLSLFHAFSNRQKTSTEKQIMLFFAVLTCAFSGFRAGTYMLFNSAGWIAIFPLWNMITCYFLVVAWKTEEVNEDNINDENARLIEVISSIVILSLIFFLCNNHFKLNWAATFSICIVWATTFNNTINSILLRKRNISA